METEKRKQEHIDICLNKDISFRKTAGFEKYNLIHNALPEIDFKELNLSTEFLGKKIDYPLYISPITGGTELAEKINNNLAYIAEKYNIPICVGSQRAAIENKELEKTFQIREIAKKTMVFANVGAVQLNYGFKIEHFQKAIDMVKADALVLHMNPLQEAIQPEGDTNFSELLPKIKELISKLNIPVIAKEVGHGISGKTAEKLEQVGISCIDVAGAGGTSFAAVEGHRSKNNLGEVFRDWGIPTAECITQIRATSNIPIIASGGIRNGIDIVKSICLGANIAGIAAPLLKPASCSKEELCSYFDNLIKQIKIAMFCIGAKEISELKMSGIKDS